MAKLHSCLVVVIVLLMSGVLLLKLYEQKKPYRHNE
jgi:hypothetical protein